MTWQGWTALGVLGAAVAVPILKKRMHRASNNSQGAFSNSGSDLSTMGGRNAPASNTWAQGSGTP